MIVQNVLDSNSWCRVTPLLERATAYLQATDFSLLPEGRQEIAGDDMFAVVQRYQTADADTLYLEQHLRYADVQYIVSGQEDIFLCHSQALRHIALPYDEAGDIVFYQDPDIPLSRLRLTAGQCAVFFPEDCHKTRCSVCPSVSQSVCKVIVKIKL